MLFSVLQVNDRLHEMDINFIENSKATGKDYSVVKEGDVVILPAFGATIQEMQMLDEKLVRMHCTLSTLYHSLSCLPIYLPTFRKVQIVDTTCPWVSKVWNAVDSHTKAGQTSVIHGKYAHEETIATASFCDNYIIVKVTSANATAAHPPCSRSIW